MAMKHIILSLLFCLSVLSCSNSGKTGVNQEEIDSSLYLNKDIKIGDSISTLLKKNLVTPDIEYSSEFHLVNKNYCGIEFDEVDVYDSDTVRCLTYKYTPQNLEKAKEKYDQITSLFYKEIGNAAIDTSFIEKEDGLPKIIRYHETTWIKDKKKFFVSFMTHDWLFDDDSYFLLLIIQRDESK
mgnify:FL=1